MIYHLTTANEWKEAQAQGIYAVQTLETEGFIHCSTRDQVEGVAERYFAGKTGLVLLHLDERALDAKVKYERASNGESFPHIYGPINLEAVVKAEPFEGPVAQSAPVECATCRKPKATFACGLCGESLCKSCDEFLIEGSFDFRERLPVEISHSHYCPSCHASHVEPAREEYDAMMAQAKSAYFFFSTQKRHLPVIRKALKTVTIEGADRNEVILRLAFRAIEHGFNSIIEAEVGCEKIRNEGYQKSLWRGTGLPAFIDVARLEARHE